MTNDTVITLQNTLKDLLIILNLID
jgi:hypothetical protein